MVIEQSYSTVALYIGITKVWDFLSKSPIRQPAKYLLCDSRAALTRHTQAKKCLQINFKSLHQIAMKFWFFIEQILLLTDYLMPLDKSNAITAKTTGLISLLFYVTLSWDEPFFQLQQLQCLYCEGLSLFSFVLQSFLHYRLGDNLQ